MKYKRVVNLVKAEQWVGGKHRLIRPWFTDPTMIGPSCPCTAPLNKHGILNGYKVCPNDWIVTTPDGNHTVYHPADFTKGFVLA